MLMRNIRYYAALPTPDGSPIIVTTGRHIVWGLRFVGRRERRARDAGIMSEPVPEAVVPEAVVPEAVAPEAVVPEAVEAASEREGEGEGTKTPPSNPTPPEGEGPGPRGGRRGRGDDVGGGRTDRARGGRAET